MTFIAEGGGRTVTNSMAIGARKVYEVTTSAVLDCVRSEYNEVVKTGDTVTEQIVYHIIADTEGEAHALYQKRWGSEFQRHTLISIKPLFVIDAEISTRNG